MAYLGLPEMPKLPWYPAQLGQPRKTHSQRTKHVRLCVCLRRCVRAFYTHARVCPTGLVAGVAMAAGDHDEGLRLPIAPPEQPPPEDDLRAFGGAAPVGF